MIPKERHTGPNELTPDPETDFALTRQLESLISGGKLAVLMVHKQKWPSGFSYKEAGRLKLYTQHTERGTFIFDPTRISTSKIGKHAANHTHWKILGHVEPKSDFCDSVVVAMQDGKEIQSSYCNRSNVATQVSIFKRYYPGADILYGGPEIEQALLLLRRLLTVNGAGNN